MNTDKLHELRTCLAFHDWHYQRSDDSSMHRKGRLNEERIRGLLRELKALGQGIEAQELYKRYSA